MAPPTENFFKDYTDEEREKIRLISKELHYPQGSVVYRKGEPGFGFFIIVKGAISLGAKKGGEDYIYAELKEGEFFGEIDINETTRRLTNAVCSTDCTFRVITRSNFDTLIKINPITSLKIMRTMSTRLRAIEAGTTEVKVKKGPEPERKGGKIVTFFSPKNHVGQTTLAINLAGGLAGLLKKKVCLIDLDLQFGDIFFILFPNRKSKPRTLGELAQEDSLAPEVLKNYFLTHSETGMEVIAAPNEPEQSELISQSMVQTLISILRETYDYVIFDTHGLLSDINIALFDNSDKILLTMAPNRMNIKGVKGVLALFKQLYPDHFASKLSILVNHVSREKKNHRVDIEMELPMRPEYYLYDDSDLFSQTTNEGKILALPGVGVTGETVKQLKTLICQLAGVDPTPYLAEGMLNKLKSFFS